MSKKMIHWKNDSGEIDVFEAAKYFSAANEEILQNKQSLRCGRMSLDMPMPMMRNSSIVPSQTIKPSLKDQKKYKQPSSPGGRLASFLNSLFNQKTSKKKKSSKSSLKDEDESPGGRRKRRSSISHFSFRSSNNITTTNASNSGFRTPPPYAYTPTKSYKDFRSFPHDHHQIISLPSNNKIKTTQDYSWLDDKLKLSKNGAYLDNYKNTNNGSSVKNKTHNKVVVVDDDDANSDSSSDLFDLPNIDLDSFSSSGLPVYETTHMVNIKRGAPISSGSI